MRRLMVFIVLATFLSSCGERFDANEVVDGVLAKRAELVSVLGEVKDVASAKRASEDIDRIGDELVVLGEQALKVDEPTNEEKSKINQRVLSAMSGMDLEVQNALKEVADDPAVMKIVLDAMERFAKKVNKAEESFKFLTVASEKG